MLQTKTISSEVECTSEEEEKIKPKKEFLTPSKENIPVIELSGSESK